MVSRGELYAIVRQILEKSGTDSSGFEAGCIFEKAFGRPLPMIIMDRELDVPEEKASEILKMAEKRGSGYPLQYILGEWDFFGHTFKIGEGVLIPRPDTETLVEQTLELCRKNSLNAPVIADLCSGSGCIAVSLSRELPGSEVYAVELSDDALPYLTENVRRSGKDVHIIKGDVLDSLTVQAVPELDIIVSNPPYLTEKDMSELQTEVACEPEKALFGGVDGLDFYRKMTPLWKNALKKGGFIIYEFGIGQHNEVSRILEENGFTDIRLSRDTGGIIRTAAAHK